MPDDRSIDEQTAAAARPPAAPDAPPAAARPPATPGACPIASTSDAPAREPGTAPQTTRRDAGANLSGGSLAAAIYIGASFAAALVFWLVTTFAGDYPAVARYGGAVWVFVLFMIVLMPVVIPRVRNRQRRREVA